MALKLKETVVFEKNDTGYLLDVRGYGCPHVQIYAEKAIAKIEPQTQLTIVFDNPSSGESISYICNAGNHDLLHRDETNGTFTWQIRKA